MAPWGSPKAAQGGRPSATTRPSRGSAGTAKRYGGDAFQPLHSARRVANLLVQLSRLLAARAIAVALTLRAATARNDNGPLRGLPTAWPEEGAGSEIPNLPEEPEKPPAGTAAAGVTACAEAAHADALAEAARAHAVAASTAVAQGRKEPEC